MNIYREWGFNNSPFQTITLPSDESGNKLIVARENDIKKIIRRLNNPPQIVTIEGPNGIGKTSLINICLFRLVKNNNSPPFFFPCKTIFQIESYISSEEFVRDVYREIAQTIISHVNLIGNKNQTKKLKLSGINDLLNLPSFKSYNATAGYGLSIGIGKTVEPNTSEAYENSGMRRTINEWLVTLFGEDNNGGVICVLDNLELVKDKFIAINILEGLRDSLFTIRGLRWIVCGALGVVTNLFSSPRLEGLLHDPIQIGEINKENSYELFTKRINYYKRNMEYYLPITLKSFILLFDILRGNIRNVLKYSNDYCLFIAESNLQPFTEDSKNQTFHIWLEEKINEIKKQVSPHLEVKDIKLFRLLTYTQQIDLSEFKKMEYEDKISAKKSVDLLIEVGLISQIITTENNDKINIQLTPKGCLVQSTL